MGPREMSYVYLAVAIVAEVVATSTLRSTEGFTRLWPSLVVAVGYVTAFYFLSLTLKDIPVGIAYALWSGVGIVLVAGFAWLRHGQTLDPAALIGLGLIIAGVAVVQLFSKSLAH